jgi:hypothetical protein
MPSCGGTGAAGRADNKMGPLGFPTVVTIQQTQEEEIGQVAPGRTPAFKNRLNSKLQHRDGIERPRVRAGAKGRI